MLLLQDAAIGFDLGSMWEGLIGHFSARWWQILALVLVVVAW